MGLVIQTAAAAEPVSVTDLKTHLRIDTTADDTYLLTVIKSARDYYESHTNRTTINTTFDLFLNGWDDWRYAYNGVISLPRPPLSSVTHVKYYDTDNVEQTWSTAEYVVNTRDEPGTICVADGYVYPQTYAKPNSVNIRYVAGEGSAASNVAAKHVRAVTFLCGHLYENRESTNTTVEVKEVPMAYDAFAIMDQVWVFP